MVPHAGGKYFKGWKKWTRRTTTTKTTTTTRRKTTTERTNSPKIILKQPYNIAVWGRSLTRKKRDTIDEDTVILTGKCIRRILKSLKS
jgi:hypothetical protein